MTRIQRIQAVLAGMAMIACALVMMVFPQYGYAFRVLVLAFSLTVYGLRKLVYYFTMARHMVGGRAVLYVGIIVFDLGMFTGSLTDIPQLHIVAYLFAVHLVTGGLSVARGVEAKKAGASLWRFSMSYGIANLLIAAACLASLWLQEEVLVYAYAIGLAYAACVRIASAFRRTAIIYIP